MLDTEKIIEGLKHCTGYGLACFDEKCPYADESGFISQCRGKLMRDALALIKEQEAVRWTKCTEKMPDKDGDYLVVRSIMGMFNIINVCAFTMNLHEIDEFDFPDEERPGWYEHDSETGYFEWTGITHWAELPKMPDDIAEGSVK